MTMMIMMTYSTWSTSTLGRALGLPSAHWTLKLGSLSSHTPVAIGINVVAIINITMPIINIMIATIPLITMLIRAGQTCPTGVLPPPGQLMDALSRQRIPHLAEIFKCR